MVSLSDDSHPTGNPMASGALDIPHLLHAKGLHLGNSRVPSLWVVIEFWPQQMAKSLVDSALWVLKKCQLSTQLFSACCMDFYLLNFGLWNTLHLVFVYSSSNSSNIIHGIHGQTVSPCPLPQPSPRCFPIDLFAIWHRRSSRGTWPAQKNRWEGIQIYVYIWLIYIYIGIYIYLCIYVYIIPCPY